MRLKQAEPIKGGLSGHFRSPANWSILGEYAKYRAEFKLKDAIEGFALQKPRLPVAAISRQARRLAQDLGEEPPSY
jgi:hypothetical protein